MEKHFEPGQRVTISHMLGYLAGKEGKVTGISQLDWLEYIVTLDEEDAYGWTSYTVPGSFLERVEVGHA